MHPPRHSHHLLIVDDSAEACAAVGLAMLNAGFEVAITTSGLDALALFESGLRPCVVLLDLRMPDMDGWTVWERMRGHPELARISVVSMSASAEDDERAQRVGIHEGLRKPVDTAALIAAVERHCERRPALNLRTRSARAAATR